LYGSWAGHERIGVLGVNAARALEADDAGDRPPELAHLENRPVPRRLGTVVVAIADGIERCRESERARAASPRDVP
jgi:hypothetical protein